VPDLGDTDARMTPVAASILGYILGVCTALLLAAIVLLVRGGGAMRDHEREEARHGR